MKVGARFRQLRCWCYLSMRFATVLAVAVPLARAQSTGGRIRGTVMDPSGGAVAAATVQLINEGTHPTREALSGANGEYIFIEVPGGRFDVHLDPPGFQ